MTEGLSLEKKNKDAIKIPFSRSPKVAITTNYAIKGKGSSFERRKWELELAQYYTKDFTPLKEFKKMMFAEWDDDEWCQFDNYMIECLQLYLKFGLIKSDFVNLKVRKLSAETCHEFIEWCGVVGGSINHKLVLDTKLYMNDLYLDFVEDNPDFAPKSKMTVSRRRFYKWLEAYGEFKYDCNPEEGRETVGKWIRFRKKSVSESQSYMEF